MFSRGADTRQLVAHVLNLKRMKHLVIVLLPLVFVSLGLAQTPSTSPPPEGPRIRNFGHSLEKHDEKKRGKSSPEQKRGPAKTNDEEIIRVETDLVIHDVLVTDQKGNVITGLNKNDFVVFDNAVPQGIEIFSSGARSTIPRSIVLMFDYALLQTHLLKTSIEGAKTLIDKLEPHDKMAIVTTDMVLRQDYTTDKWLLKKTLDLVETMGRQLAIWYGRGAKLEEIKKFKTLEESLGDGDRRHAGQFGTLIAVLNEMFDQPERQRMIIYQGDGSNVIWLKPDKDLPYPVSHLTRMNSGMKYVGAAKSMSSFGFTEVKERIEASRSTIYSVITGMRLFGLPEKERLERIKIVRDEMNKVHGWLTVDSPDERRKYEGRDEKVRTAGQAAMYRIAELSGGNTAVMEKPGDAERIYSDIFAVIKNRYVLGYYPTDSKKGEKRRTVKVEVRGHPEYFVTGRTTYILQ